MSGFELRPSASEARTGDEQLVWPDAPRGSGALRSQLTPWLAEFGAPSNAAIDLVRFATAAYLADQRTRRPPTFTRSLSLKVQVVDVRRWSGAVLDKLADLLGSLTGDAWTLWALPEEVAEPPTRGEASDAAERICLLSGGLDSLAGAVLSSQRPGTLYLGHWDNPAVKAAQDRVRLRFIAAGNQLNYIQVWHGLQGAKVEHSTRSRSLLFMALATALATARHAATVEVPENGFTSLNPPLGPERGGALSTRSTHPTTIQRLNEILRALRIRVVVENPYQNVTKGELVARAAPAMRRFDEAAADTLSCAKLDGRLYKGGNPNHHCGLCFACIVRRASFLGAGVPDRTPYLSETLTGASLTQLRGRRSPDVDGVRQLLYSGVDDLDIMSLGPFPDDFDVEEAVALCRRALGELASVPL